MQILQVFGIVLLTIGDGKPIQVERVHVWQDGYMVYVLNNEPRECWFTGGRTDGKASYMSCEEADYPNIPKIRPFQVRSDLIVLGNNER